MKKKLERHECQNKETGENTSVAELAAKVDKSSGIVLVGDISEVHIKELAALLDHQVDVAVKNWPDESFFVEVNLRKDPFTEIIRKLPATRRTCPEPFYDQMVFYYNHIKCELENMWVIPDMETCYNYLVHPPSVLSKADRDLYDNIRKFDSGELDHTVLEFSKKREKVCRKNL